jgi:hypothetical protein
MCSRPFSDTPQIDHLIACLPTCFRVTNLAKYSPITYDEYGEYRVCWLDNDHRTKLAEA